MANTNYLNISKDKEKIYLRNNLENDSIYNRNKKIILILLIHLIIMKEIIIS